MLVEIKRWDNGKVIHSIEADTLAKAVELLARDGKRFYRANLSSADLSSADLSSADLSSANLSYANLSYANLSSADLSSADLSSADLSSANLRSANLSYANLRSADLSSANLRSANLRSANLKNAKDMRLPTGETWLEYLTETVPALLTAAGKPLESFAKAFDCHDWTNCPMAHAFDVHELREIPILFRPRADQFIQFFDSKLIPWPLPTKEELTAETTEPR